MKRLYDAVQRFCARHPRFGIPNLMLYIVAGNAIVYFLMMFTRTTDASALSFLALDTGAVLKGELWRLATYVFVPTNTRIFWLMISLYFYYWIGTTLERQWGTAKFTLYYISGVLLTAAGVLVASLISGVSYTVAGSYYVNLSMFFAFAFLFPNTQVLLFFFIPIRMKWLAYLDAALFAVDVVRSLLIGNLGSALLPIIALLNFAVFIWPEVHYMANRAAYRCSSKKRRNISSGRPSSRATIISALSAGERIRTIPIFSSAIAANVQVTTASVRIIFSPMCILPSDNCRKRQHHKEEPCSAGSMVLLYGIIHLVLAAVSVFAAAEVSVFAAAAVSPSAASFSGHVVGSAVSSIILQTTR